MKLSIDSRLNAIPYNHLQRMVVRGALMLSSLTTNMRDCDETKDSDSEENDDDKNSNRSCR